MKTKYFSAGFYACFLLFFNLFFIFSCKAEEELSGGGDVPVSIPKTEGDASGLPKSAAVVFDAKAEDDLILASYQDPALREKVLGFFGEIAGSLDVAEIILSNAAIHNIPPALAFSLCAEESAFNTKAFNRNRNQTVDRGLFQLNSASFPDLAAEDFNNPGINARYGLSHLRWCLDSGGTDVAGLAMYNAGTARVRSSGTPKQTLDYISRILNRRQSIEENFMTEYAGFSAETDAEEKAGKPFFRLAMLKPLGR